MISVAAQIYFCQMTGQVLNNFHIGTLTKKIKTRFIHVRMVMFAVKHIDQQCAFSGHNFQFLIGRVLVK